MIQRLPLMMLPRQRYARCRIDIRLLRHATLDAVASIYASALRHVTGFF